MTQTDQGAAPSGTESAVGAASAVRPGLATLITAYFRHVADEDQPHSADEVITIVEGSRRLADRRVPREVKIRVHNPTQNVDGWSGTSTVVDIINDDMPYLVDTVVGALGSSGATVYRVLHPILAVQRDDHGQLQTVAGESVWAADPAGTIRESWMHVLIDRVSDAERAEAIEESIRSALSEVRTVVEDTGAMTGLARQVAAELRASFRITGDPQEAADLLDWFASDNLTFLGYRFDPIGGASPTGGLGVLRVGLGDRIVLADDSGGSHASGADAPVLSIGQVPVATALSRDTPALAVAVRTVGPDGRLSGEHRFLGALTPRARNSDVTVTPVLRQTVRAVLGALGAMPASYSGQRASELLSTYPRAELFWADQAMVLEVVSGQLQLAGRRRLKVFLQPDPHGRFISVLVFLPRDRYTTARRLAMQQILLDALHGSELRYTARIGDSVLAAVHFTVTTDPAAPVDVDLPELTAQLRASIRTWEDRLLSTVVSGDEDLDAAGALSRYSEAFDEAYKEDYPVDDAIDDLRRLDALSGPDDLALSIAAPAGAAPGEFRLKLYVTGSGVTLSRALPVLQHMGAEVIDERPYEVRRTDGTPAHIYDFGLRLPVAHFPDDPAKREVVRARFSDAFIATWRGLAEVDGFNTLVLSAGMDWRSVAVLRSYARYLRQIGSAYTQGYMEQVLGANPAITADLSALFTARFEPAVGDARDRRCAELTQRITAALDAVTSLDADRILRTYLRLIVATTRTNVYRTDSNGNRRSCLSFKLDPHKVPDVPKPVPAYEVWVYSPRLEGVHLRFGAVARGGLRWSDRPDDFRTEVLGLVKAQEVKNAVIVPVGAKGGFVLKRSPAPTGDQAADREALLAEGIACYRMFIASLLDVTDNRVAGQVVPPEQVVRHDADDTYLVVAADKGTASFSDIANAVAIDYGYWLGDAFASGGSAGYDHKGMGITARGAWESVRHHFRELGVDTQSHYFSCVGIGDMSGDVFGNGMMRSEHIRLIAAFDHRHVFIDPDPDPDPALAERRRLFHLSRSSWADYDPALISAGGGVFSRSLKSISITEQMRAALGIEADVQALSPAELIRMVLLAPVDLLWNGGIGTYIKATTETNAQVGDKANDVVRVNGADLRVKVVGEGGNLGVTQLGRIEFARAGGRINTDAIDNSAGVDTSDHEVNIKIALQPLLLDSSLAESDRNHLLHEMTDEVAALVLADNTAQNRLLGVSRAHAGPMLSVHARQIAELVEAGRLDRALEFLPTPAQIDARIATGEGLSSPELSVLIAYTKAALATTMLASDLPESLAFADTLPHYFPTAMRERFADAITAHPLAREIVTTVTVNQVVNGGGITYAFRLGEEMAASQTDAIRAYAVTNAVFGLPTLLADISAADHVVPAACQDMLTLLTRRLLDRAARWFLTLRPQPLDVRAEVARYSEPVAALSAKMPALLRGVERDNVARDAATLVGQGATADLADRVAYSLYTFSNLDITDVAMQAERDLDETAKLYYGLSAHLDVDRLLTGVTNLQRGDRWHALARQAVRDDLYRSMRLITADVLSTSGPDQDVESKIEQWESENAARLARARSTLAQIADAGAGDLAALSVAAREIRSMLR